MTDNTDMSSLPSKAINAIQATFGHNANINQITPLGTGGSNAPVYKITIDQNDYIVRLNDYAQQLGLDKKWGELCREMMTAENYVSHLLAKHHLGANIYYPDLTHPLAGVVITGFIPSAHLNSQQCKDPETQQQIIESIKQLHQLPIEQNKIHTWDLPTRCQFLLQMLFDRSGLPQTMQNRLSQINQNINVAKDLLNTKYGLVHGDFHPGNFFQHEGRILFIDLNDTGLADQLGDIAKLANTIGLDKTDGVALLKRYQPRTDDNALQRFFILRLLSDLYDGLWLLFKQPNLTGPVSPKINALIHPFEKADNSKKDT